MGTRKRIVSLMIIMIFIPIVLILEVNYEYDFSKILEKDKQAKKELVEINKKNIENIVKNLEENMNIYEVIMENEDRERVMEYFGKFKEENSIYKNFYYVDEKSGKMFITKELKLPEDYDPRQRPWYIKGKRDGEYYSYPYRGFDDKYTVTLAKAIKNNEEKIGVMGVDIDFRKVMETSGYIYERDFFHIEKQNDKDSLIVLVGRSNYMWEEVLEKEEGYYESIIDGEKLGVYFENVEEIDGKVIGISHIGEMEEKNRKGLYVAILLGLILVLLEATVLNRYLKKGEKEYC